MIRFNFSYEVRDDNNPELILGWYITRQELQLSVVAESQAAGKYWMWNHAGAWHDIIAYRVVEVRP